MCMKLIQSKRENRVYNLLVTVVRLRVHFCCFSFCFVYTLGLGLIPSLFAILHDRQCITWLDPLANSNLSLLLYPYFYPYRGSLSLFARFFLSLVCVL